MGRAAAVVIFIIFASVLKPGCSLDLLIALPMFTGFFAMFVVSNYMLTTEIGGLLFAGMAIGLILRNKRVKKA